MDLRDRQKLRPRWPQRRKKFFFTYIRGLLPSITATAELVVPVAFLLNSMIP